LSARGNEGPPLLEAQRTPIRYYGGVSKAWAAKIEGDVLPQDRSRSSLPSAVAVVAACLFIGVFFAGRQSAVGAAPDLARLYAAVGLPVNLARLEINGLAAERGADKARRQVVLRGTIRSLSNVEEAMPPLSARLYALDGSVAGLRNFQAPAPTIGAGDEMPFELELASVPEQAAEIVVRFRRPEEPVVVSDGKLRYGMTATGAGVLRPIFSAEEIAARVEAMAGEIASTEPQALLAIVVLKGGFVFAADLVRALARAGVRLEIEFISLSSYGTRQKTSGEVRIVRDIEVPVAGRDVLIIDDVLDSGLTLKFARDLMRSRGARRGVDHGHDRQAGGPTR
jgi:hypothetical protein